MTSVIADYLYEQGVKIFCILTIILAVLILFKAVVAIIIYKVKSKKEKEK